MLHRTRHPGMGILAWMAFPARPGVRHMIVIEQRAVPVMAGTPGLRAALAAGLMMALVSGCATPTASVAPRAAAADRPVQLAMAGRPAPDDLAPIQVAQFPRFGGSPALADLSDPNDPLEPVNRVVFGFNEVLDVLLIRPAAELYRVLLPDAVQLGLRNILQNLRSPLDLTNQLLQGDWEQAGVVVKRFAINTTAGIGGIVDVAARNGLVYEYESFEQTLAIWGVPEGPYLVLPVIGSSSLRDAPALLAESYVDPVRLYAANNDLEWLTYGRVGVTIVDTRAQYIDIIDDLRRNSFDYYAAMRSLYRQRRDGWVRDGAPAQDQLPEIPDFDLE